ncbi:hypothetical protein H5410_028287 [Solanum commersonii]|uniref:Uncharacterized protein n=1 Tax=Solanum commersonii TaxID=4109 RepID=A0A9J5Z1H4_SOLCO|nr:hypothetical protein H5410_028287 [Solanum commersonii]
MLLLLMLRILAELTEDICIGKYTRWGRRSRSTLSDLFYSMANAYRKDNFEKLMAKLENVDGRVKKYLQDAGYERWSRSHATVNRGRMMTSNIAECINGCLVDA